MKKTDLFLLCIFTTCFFMCSVIMAANSFYKGFDKFSSDDYFLEETDWTIVVEGKDFPSDTTVETSEALPTDTPSENPSTQEEFLPSEESVESLPSEDEADFFQDTLFIGDSRTVGLMEYGDIASADFFADSGMSVFSLGMKKLPFKEHKSITFKEVLASKQYSKVYLMLGINELGYNFDRLEGKYKEVLDYILSVQTEAVVYICANMHVTKAQSAQDTIYNNDNINRVNQMIASLANNENIFYLDVNPLFDDEEGNLAEKYSSDAFHVFGKHYTEWTEWLREAAKTGSPS